MCSDCSVLSPGMPLIACRGCTVSHPLSPSQSMPRGQEPSLLGWQYCTSLARGRPCISSASAPLHSVDLIQYQTYNNRVSTTPALVLSQCSGLWGAGKTGGTFPIRRVALCSRCQHPGSDPGLAAYLWGLGQNENAGTLVQQSLRISRHSRASNPVWSLVSVGPCVTAQVTHPSS